MLSEDAAVISILKAASGSSQLLEAQAEGMLRLQVCSIPSQERQRLQKRVEVAGLDWLTLKLQLLNVR